MTTATVFKHENSKRPMNIAELTNTFNKFHSINNGEMYDESRITGQLCECPSGRGSFVLLPLDSQEVKEGGKLYMRCQRCGCYSHL